MSDHPRWKVVLVCAVLAGMAALTVAVYLADRPSGRPVAAATATPTPTPAASPRTATATPTRVSPTPTASPSPSLDPRLIELRATDQYEELAEAPRAALAQHSRYAYENFAPRVGNETVSWPNKDDVWNQLAPAFRDEALLLGREHDLPLWHDSNAIPTGVQATWSDEMTHGRGYLFLFSVTYDAADGPRMRYRPVLVAFDKQLNGSINAEMPPFEHREADFESSIDEHDAATDNVWAWIQSLPPGGVG